MKTALKLGALVAVMACSAAAQAEAGKIKLCRIPTISSLSDGKVVTFPPLNYVGDCDKNGDNCRTITVSAEGGTVGKEKKACAVLNATVTKSDGQPIKAGTLLRPSFSSDEFQGYDSLASVFITSSKVIVSSDFK
ncbi:hypothetical protein [Ralstonia sp. ASV6]|uniref:hypothetical protein n=1 Tax=Ralstonia sp. ASV6 TaxID=2795124 RepID=UPI0018EA5351|nr:hypothetical protein [Ralstonia sp. ASV6]